LGLTYLNVQRKRSSLTAVDSVDRPCDARERVCGRKQIEYSMDKPWDGDLEARVLRLLEQQNEVEERKRYEQERHESLTKESKLLQLLLHEALHRVEELDSEIETRRREIFEVQRYVSAVRTLLEEEQSKENRLLETLDCMNRHQEEQKEVMKEFYEHLLVKKGCSKKQLDDIVVSLGGG
jgi:chromosome segregation ATPase